MKILAAPNALKGTLDAADAAQAIRHGIHRVFPDAEVTELPIADGGDGTAALLTRALHGEEITASVSDPLGRPHSARYGFVEAGKLAILDVSSASGLALLREAERDPLRTSSAGTGELLLHALARGARTVLLGVGGSATVDGGMGLLQVLGARFHDREGSPVPATGSGLLALSNIDTSALDCPALLEVACDVENPLTGPEGAARAFAPQKGANRATVAELESALERYADLLEQESGRSIRHLTFGGAAGGIAAALHALLDARLRSGVELVLDHLEFNRSLQGADWVVTAEGRLDAGSLSNKGPVGVARRAQKHGVRSIALVGSIDPELDLTRTPFSDVVTLPPPEGGAYPTEGAALRREACAALTRAAELAARRLLSLPSSRNT